MKKDVNLLAEEFLIGHHENHTKQASKAIEDLENLRPDFSLLERMLQSEFDSSVEADLYIIYNSEGLCQPSILRIIKNLMSHPNKEIRMWAQACLR